MRVTVVIACTWRAYIYESVDDVDFRDHSDMQSEGPVRVSASVLGREETEKIFGLSLYDQGIQPVWLEVENKSAVQIRYAPVGTDRFYFSPLEVAYKNRGGYSDEAREEMARRFHRLSMPRYIGAGETRDGFVFTHADSAEDRITFIFDYIPPGPLAYVPEKRTRRPGSQPGAS